MILETVRRFPKWFQQKTTKRSKSSDDKAIKEAEKIHEAMNKFPDICEEYTRINSIELSPVSGLHALQQ